MSDQSTDLLEHLTTDEAERRLSAGRSTCVLLPVGSVEPHGPHLPLATDTIISQAAIQRAALRLERDHRLAVLIAPPVHYAVTEYAQGFAGAISIPPAVLTAYLRAVIEGILADARVAHVCLVSNHLEPDNEAAVRASIEGLDPVRASVASPLAKRWARTLSDEFKRGECHAGRYETSILLAAAPELVDHAAARGLPEVPVSLSAKIKQGITTFTAMGMGRAYAGAPALATPGEGHELLEKLAAMIETEVVEHMLGGPGGTGVPGEFVG